MREINEGPMPAYVTEKMLSWADFKTNWHSRLGELGGGDAAGHRINGNFVFRGTGCSDHHLISSFDRFLAANNLDRSNPFEKYTQAILSYIEAGRRVGLLNENYDISPDNKKPEADKNFHIAEAFAQHNGFPTRLLDWSQSPYIAAFFAATNATLCRSGWISIWALNKKEIPSLFGRDVEVFERKDYGNKRLVSQRGCFTRNESNLPNLDDLFLAGAARMHRNPSWPVLLRFDIPVSEHLAMIPDLAYMGIDFLSVYPDNEGVKEIAKFKLLTGA